MPPEEVDGSPLEEPLLVSSSSGEGSSLAVGSNNDNGGSGQITDGDDEAIDKDITLPCTGGKKSANHNVVLNLVICLLYGLSDSLWNGAANAAYLKKLGRDHNGPLGDLEAVQGLASLITALPVGYLADRVGRSRVIAAGGILELLAIASQSWLMEWIGTDESAVGENQSRRTTGLWIMGAIMFCWGTAGGVVNGPASALFADSTPQGQRSEYYNYLFSCYIGASSVGPLASIVLFQTLGDDWSLYDLRIVIYVGLSIAVVASVLMLFFDDRKALERAVPAVSTTAGDSLTDNDAAERNQQRELAQRIIPDEEEPEEGRQFCPPVSDSRPSSPDRNTTDGDGDHDRPLTGVQKWRQWIPYIIFAQGLILAVGSGMTVKFFPLFFKDEVGMRYVDLNSEVPRCMSLFTQVLN